MDDKLTLEEFGQTIKMKYPEYQGFSDKEIGEKTLQKFPEYNNRIKGDEGFVADLKGIGTGIKESAIERSDKFGEIDDAQDAGEQGAVRSLLQKFGQGAGFASDIVGETFIGAIKALTPQGTQEKAGEVIESGVEKIADTELAEKIVGVYEGLDPEKQRDLQAVLGVLSLGTDAVGGAVLKNPVKAGAKKTVEAVGNTAQKVSAGTGKAVDTVVGATKGTGELIEKGVESVGNTVRRVGTNIDSARATREAVNQLPTETAGS